MKIKIPMALTVNVELGNSDQLADMPVLDDGTIDIMAAKGDPKLAEWFDIIRQDENYQNAIFNLVAALSCIRNTIAPTEAILEHILSLSAEEI